MLAKLLKLFLMVAGFWFLIYPEPYYILFCILLILPVVTICIITFNNPNFKKQEAVEQKFTNTYIYELVTSFNFATLVLGFRIFLDFNFENTFLIYYPIALVVLMVLFLIIYLKGLKTPATEKTKSGLSLLLGINIVLPYLLIAAYGMNCVFDDARPVVYNVEVLGKDSSSYKSGRNYYLIVTPWGNLKSAKRVRVKKNIYDSIDIKNIVPVNRKKGLLGFGWYYTPLNN